ncbi:MAG: four-helix bundle copper-binding protein [Leptothrix ochracea]|uniref:four-helix bundle copper-binding protein n=1 Tax=Leptothrix ochracea TaxID=735331 RepID=UPI0034E2EF5E
MERRHLMQGLGGLTLAALSASVLAAAEDPHAHHHHVAAGAGAGGKPTRALIASASDCVIKGEACLAHCLQLLGDGDKEMAACAQSVNQMLPVCTALQKLASQDSKYLKAYAALAAQVCEDCEKECRKHEKKHDECKACAESCAACLKECKAYAA